MQLNDDLLRLMTPDVYGNVMLMTDMEGNSY
jgi:hypothetical protein